MLFTSKETTTGESSSDEINSIQGRETQSFLPGHNQNDDYLRSPQRGYSDIQSPGPWKWATGVLMILLGISVSLRIGDSRKPSYETGFDTDLGGPLKQQV